jgi:hypothetical protein
MTLGMVRSPAGRTIAPGRDGQYATIGADGYQAEPAPNIGDTESREWLNRAAFDRLYKITFVTLT